MSVRDKIANFGGSSSSAPGKDLKGGSAPPSWARKTTTSSAHFSAASISAKSAPTSAFSEGAGSGPVRKLNVPDVFSNTTKSVDPPGTSSSRDSLTTSTTSLKELGDKRATAGNAASSSSQTIGGKPAVESDGNEFTGQSSGNPPSAHSNGSPASGKTNNEGSSGSSNGRASLPLVSSSGNDGLDARSRSISGGRRSRMSTGSGESVSGATTRPKRDLLGLNSVGSPGDSAKGGASDFIVNTGRPRKTGQAGPRKLQVAGKGKARISAEKQRAALGLDKSKDTEEVKVKESKAANQSKATSRQSNVVPTTKASARASADYSSPASTTFKRPTPPLKSVVSGGVTTQKAGSSFPSASALRSSGHNLW